MIFWNFLEVVVVVLILLIFITQIFIPLWKGTKLFPFIRRRELNAQLKEVKEQVDREGALSEIEKEMEKLKIRKEKESNEGMEQQQQTESGPGDSQKGNQKGS